MLKQAVIALSLALGLAGAVGATGPQDSVLSQQIQRYGKPIS